MTTTTPERAANGALLSRGPDDMPTEVLAARRRRNRTRIIVGSLITVLAVYGIAAKFNEVNDGVSILVVARPVSEGSTIQQADLREAVVSLDGRLSAVPASERSRFVGKVAAVDLLPGTNVTEASISTGPVVGASQLLVGATLRQGRFPAALRSGESVRLLRVPARADSAVGVVVAQRALVREVAKKDDGLGTTDVALIVEGTEYEAVAAAAARDELVLVGLGPQG